MRRSLTKFAFAQSIEDPCSFTTATETNPSRTVFGSATPRPNNQYSVPAITMGRELGHEP